MLITIMNVSNYLIRRHQSNSLRKTNLKNRRKVQRKNKLQEEHASNILGLQECPVKKQKQFDYYVKIVFFLFFFFLKLLLRCKNK